MPRVIHFELVSDDPERTKKFYEEIFDWKVEKWEGPVDYWLITTGDESESGINGAFSRRQSPEDVVVNTIGVPDADEFIKRIEANGGKIIRPKSAVPGVGWMAYCEDTEGNLFGIMQEDPEAK